MQNLMRKVDKRMLYQQHSRQSRRKAVGVDGVTKQAYEENLDANLDALIVRMKRMQYKPLPVRRTYIHKPNGKLRPLGIPVYEDKLVQGAMADLLVEAYEPLFLDCSYGFRPKRSAHDVVRFINQTIMRGKVNYILEADIKGFFDNVNHDWLMRFLKHDIQDKVFLQYIKRFLIAGYFEDSIKHDSDKGTPQGGLISPVLANVYLHYVLDLWYEKAIKPRLRGETYFVRYADDFLIMFQYEDDANRVMSVLKKRLGKFSLEVAEDKTRILPFGRFRGTKESFDFLGFTVYNTKTRNGKYRVGIKTSEKKLIQKRLAVKKWLRKQRAIPVINTLQTLALSLRGHCNYYGVNGNLHALHKFYRYVEEQTYWLLNHRDQKGKVSWGKFRRIWDYFIRPPHIATDIWSASSYTV